MKIGKKLEKLWDDSMVALGFYNSIAIYSGIMLLLFYESKALKALDEVVVKGIKSIEEDKFYLIKKREELKKCSKSNSEEKKKEYAVDGKEAPVNPTEIV